MTENNLLLLGEFILSFLLGLISWLIKAKLEDIDLQIRDFRLILREIERSIGRLEGFKNLDKEK